MKQITIRGIPLEVEKIVKKEAERKRLSLNKAFISILEKIAGVKPIVEKKRMALHHDLDRFCGIWGNKDGKIFDKKISFQRKIDEDVWKQTK